MRNFRWVLWGAAVSVVCCVMLTSTFGRVPPVGKDAHDAWTPVTVDAWVSGAVSHSLLNAYHVLYEESVCRLERANAKKLPEILRFLLEGLKGRQGRMQADPALVRASQKRAQIVVGTALRLLDPAYESPDRSLRRIVHEEADRVIAGKGVMKPPWLGSLEADLVALDYERYKVRGFYTQSEVLSRYFRAVAWLQSIPFRVSKDDELLAILMLGNCMKPARFAGDDAKCRSYRDFYRAFKIVIGCGDDWDVITAADHVDADGRIDLGQIRRQLLIEAAAGSEPQINDQLRLAPADPEIAAEANFRILSAYRTPEAVLLHRTTDLRQFQRPMPDGLEVCIALGSGFARDKIQDPEKAELLRIIEGARPLFQGAALYLDYLDVVATLLDAPESNAPAFMKGSAWQAKSCGTVLAGWAQLRHTWILQTKSNVFYARDYLSLEQPKDLVEPEPEFFGRMARLAGRTRDILDSAHAFDEGTVDPSRQRELGGRNLDVKVLWRSLEATSQRLESIARKQLRGAPLDGPDEDFLEHYGKTLAAIMLYGGNSYVKPRDDAPRIADAYRSVSESGSRSLHIGIGRPRQLYVLYPWHGTDVLCRGAILPYYEFPHGARLTDSEWKALLDGKSCPDVPSWLKPIIRKAGQETILPTAIMPVTSDL